MLQRRPAKKITISYNYKPSHDKSPHQLFFVFSQRIWNAKCTIPTKCVINILMSTTHISILNWGLWSPISLTSLILMREGFFSFVFFYRRGTTRQNQKEEKVLNLSLFYVTINIICYITFMSKQQDLYYIFELCTLSWTFPTMLGPVFILSPVA